MMINEIEYNKEILKHFKGIKWKDINQMHKNDYMKSVQEVEARLIASQLPYYHFSKLLLSI